MIFKPKGIYTLERRKAVKQLDDGSWEAGEVVETVEHENSFTVFAFAQFVRGNQTVSRLHRRIPVHADRSGRAS